MDKQDKKVMIMVFFGIFLLTGITGMLLTVNPVTDESGTIANSMYLLGYDWSNYLIEYGGFYYKYGMVLFYTPVYALVSNPYLAYRIIMLIQAALLASGGLAAYVIIRKHLHAPGAPDTDDHESPDAEDSKLNSAARQMSQADRIGCVTSAAGRLSRGKAALIAITSAVVPASLLYSMYARADVVLIVAPWICLLFLLEASSSTVQKKRILYSILLSLISVFAYASHTRGIVILIATVMVVALGSLIMRKTVVHLPSYGISTILFFIADYFLTRFFKVPLWGADGAKHASMDVFEIDSLKEILTGEGITTMLKSSTGWLFNALTATGGLLGLGVIAAVIFIIRYFRKKDISGKELLFSIFSVLILIGTAALGLLFFFTYLRADINGTSNSRGDMIVYGRYIAGAFGPLTMLGLYSLFSRRDIIRLRSKLFAFFGFAAVIAVFGWKVAGHMEDMILRCRYFISLNTFTAIEGPYQAYTTAVISNIVPALIGAGLLSLAILAVILFLDLKNRRMLLCTLLLVYFVALFGINFYKIRYSRDLLLTNRVEVSEKFIRKMADVSDEFPYLAVDNTATNMRVYQVLFREFKVAAADSKILKNQTDYIIISLFSDLNFDNYEDDYYQFTNYHYREKSRDVVYIKGEKLKARLESMGYVFTKLVRPDDYVSENSVLEEE